ncbi:MAG: membrane protein insertase YidC [Bdellovibrionales bacterium]
MSSQKPGQMHPDDLRNLIVFVVAAVAIWAVFDHFVLKPNAAAQRAQMAQEKRFETDKTLQDLATTLDPKRDRVAIVSEGRINGTRVTIDTAELMGSISVEGGRIDDISLKNHFKTHDKKERVTLLSPAGSKFPHFVETGWVSADPKLELPHKNTKWTLMSGDVLTPKTPVTFQWVNPQGVAFKRLYQIDDHFMITVTETVTNNSGSAITVYPYSAAARRGLPETVDKRFIVHDGPLGYIGGELEEIDYDEMEDQTSRNIVSEEGWIGFGQKYWLVGLLPEQEQEKTFRFVEKKNTSLSAIRPLFQTDVMGPAQTIGTGTSAEVTHNVYAGVKNVRLLDEYAQKLNVRHFDLAVDFGVLYFLTRPLHWLLILFNSWVGNFGIAIIMLTIVIRAAVFPLANTSYKSFAILKKLGPQMQEIKENYKEDRAGMQKALMALYQKEGANPMAGCLPILLQIPIFFAMYKVIYISVEMRHAPFFGWIQDLSEKDPTSLFDLFGLMPYDAPEFLHLGIWPCLMIFFMILQQRLNPPPQDPTQKMMMIYFPYFIGYILSGFASGLVIYWTFSNALSVLQQAIIMRMMGVEIHLFKRAKKDEDKDDKKSDKGDSPKTVERD